MLTKSIFVLIFFICTFQSCQQLRSKFENENVPNNFQIIDSIKFLSEYGEDVNVDTVVDGIHFTLTPNVHDRYILPASYSGLIAKKDTAILIFRTAGVLYLANSSDSVNIDMAMIKQLIGQDNDSLIKYGVLIAPSFYRDSNQVKINCSYSIPFTDIGMPLRLRIDSSKMQIRYEVL